MQIFNSSIVKSSPLISLCPILGRLLNLEINSSLKAFTTKDNKNVIKGYEGNKKA